MVQLAGLIPLGFAPPTWPTTTAWERRLRDLISSIADDSSQFRRDHWRQVFDDQVKSTPLTIQSADPMFSLPLGEDKELWTIWLSDADFWTRWKTNSQVGKLKGADMEVRDFRNHEFLPMTNDFAAR